MLPLAEISDKYPSFTQILFCGCLLAVATILITRGRRLWWVFLVPLGAVVVLGNYIAFDEIRNPYVASAFHSEMGYAWIAACFLAWNLPLLVLPVRMLIRHCLRRPDKAFEPLCSRCGYSLIGIPSGRCPECGLIRAEGKPVKMAAPPVVR